MLKNRLDDHGQSAALTAMHYLGQSDDLSIPKLFWVLTHPEYHMVMRDLEPVLGYFLRHAKPEENAQNLLSSIADSQHRGDWTVVQRAGYLIDLLCLFGPQQDSWQNLALERIDALSASLPKILEQIPFFPGDPRRVTGDSLVMRWRLSSGVLYDRLAKLLRPPYVC
mgnify:CR=1 FL=1